jgi:LemA protein
MEALLILLGLVVLLGLWLIAVFNGLIRLRNRTQEAWSDIDVQLKRRYDLIPNLINTVKGYAKHESEVFENVTRARSEAMQAQGPAEHAQAENMLSGALKSLFAVSENYPDLRASENFMHLQQELTDTENKIQSSRRFYNGQVRDFNTKIEVFPNNMVAGVLGFKKFEFFEAVAEEKSTPQVQF